MSIVSDERVEELLATEAEVDGLKAEIERLRAALQDACANCRDCDGKGNAFTMGDETQIGCSPGASRIDCPSCTPWRAVLAVEQSVTGQKNG